MTDASAAGLPHELVRGYTRFRDGRYADEQERYRRLGELGQRPTALVVACSDSRAAPEAIFDARPGELFVVRNVAGLVPEYAPDARAHGASAALEYGVLALGISSIVVLGHGRCGGIAAVLEPGEPLSATDFVGAWVAGLRRLAEAVAAEAADDGAPSPEQVRLILERRSVERSLDRLRTFPWIREREERGELSLRGAWFDIALGELHALQADGWAPVEPAASVGRQA